MSEVPSEQINAQEKLQKLLLPDTPEAVQTSYLALEEQAKHADFDLLEQDIVVLDTETTGLSFKTCALIEISAAKISGRKVLERFETFVDPKMPVPAEITRLTHIDDSDVQGAPSPQEAVAALADFVGGLPVLAHNATFDRTFIERVPGGREVSDTWIDTLSLSRIALPRLASHKLSRMAEAFGALPVTHRASDDVDALIGMWRIILLGLCNLPQGLLEMFAAMHDDVDWVYRPIFSHIATLQQRMNQNPGQNQACNLDQDYSLDQGHNTDLDLQAHELAADEASTLAEGTAQTSPQPFSMKSVRAALVAEGRGKPRIDIEEKDAPAVAPSAQEIEQAFSAHGMISQMYEKYEIRPEQVALSLEVRKALATSSHRAIEAGTGVGKSIAYLFPEVLFAKKNKVTVGIATKTNALTDQLMSQELPKLSQAISGGITFTSLKGYEHYPCLHRMDRAVVEDLPLGLFKKESRSKNSIAEDMLTALAVSYAFSCQSVDGDLDALGIRWRYVPRQFVTTTSRECLRSQCPYFPHECLVRGARRRAAESDVVVTNHSLLLRNVALGGKILPPIRHWVIDEAHSFDAEARRQWAVELQGDKISAGFEVLGSTRTGALSSIINASAKLEGALLLERMLLKVASTTNRAMVASADFFATVHDLVSLAKNDGGYNAIALWISDEVRKSDVWQEVAEAGQHCAEVLEPAIKAITETEEALKPVDARLANNLGESTAFLFEYYEGIRLICSGRDDSYVYSAQLSRAKSGIGQEMLLAEKIDIGKELARNWLPDMHSVVFTSATIAVSHSFDYFATAVGLDCGKFSYQSKQLDSSFDFETNMAVIVPEDMPVPNDPTYLQKLEDLLFDVHVSMGGSVLTLFTNRRDMECLYRKLEARLSKQGLRLTCQERSTSPHRLRKQFLADTALSLFALKSFWEGFDASGDTLRCVVIPRLPFASPYDPLAKERERREEKAWWRYSLPEAVIATKQAAGRLIRSGSDKGILVLADSRVISKRYGKQFLSSLPKQQANVLTLHEVEAFIQSWREEHDA